MVHTAGRLRTRDVIAPTHDEKGHNVRRERGGRHVQSGDRGVRQAAAASGRRVREKNADQGVPVPDIDAARGQAQRLQKGRGAAAAA